MPSLPSITTVPSLNVEERAEILDLLFEPCTQLHTLSVSLLREQSFTGYDALITAVGEQLLTLEKSKLQSDQDWLEAILVAHPRLGEKKAESVSEQSKKEQSQLNQGGEEEKEKLVELNRAYEERFPGLRYVVFVNGRSRPVIMEDMQRRIENSTMEQEKHNAIKAMCGIASDRARKLGTA